MTDREFYLLEIDKAADKSDAMKNRLRAIIDSLPDSLLPDDSPYFSGPDYSDIGWASRKTGDSLIVRVNEKGKAKYEFEINRKISKGEIEDGDCDSFLHWMIGEVRKGDTP